MFYFLLGIYFFYIAVKAWLAILQINFIHAEAKKPAVVLEQGEYESAAAAAITNQKFEIASLFYHAAIFVGWVLKDEAKREIMQGSEKYAKLVNIWFWYIKFVVPFIILVLFISSFYDNFLK